jgi:hypothetical protein
VEATGKLCLIEDLRLPTNCRTDLSLAGISIEDLDRSETMATLTNAEGVFSIPVPASASVVRLKVGFADSIPDSTYKNVIVPLAVGPQGEVPIFTELTLQDLLDFNGVDDQTASILAYVTVNGVRTAGIEVIPPVGTLPAALYDGLGGPNDWIAGGATGPNGAALMLGVPINSATVSFTVIPDSGQQIADGVPVLDGATTIVVHETVQD